MNNKWIVEATINFLITATLLEGYHVEFYDGKDFDGINANSLAIQSFLLFPEFYI